MEARERCDELVDDLGDRNDDVVPAAHAAEWESFARHALTPAG